MKYQKYLDSPVGMLILEADDQGITRVAFVDAPEENAASCALLDEAENQLREYFEGQRKSFDLPLSLHGTPFQLAVWDALREIPYGQTRSYGDIARQLGKSGAARAVGMANYRNPICIFVPCHRVIGADGSLIGYAGGLDKKEALLKLEGVHI